MQIGERIKKVRNFCKLSQRKLGILLGFPASSVALRIAQYENYSCTSKVEMAKAIAKVLKCSDINFILNSNLGKAKSIMLDMFWLEERFGGDMQIFQLDKYIDKEDSRKAYGMYNNYTFDTVFPPVAITMNYTLINDFMREWAFRFRNLQRKNNTRRILRVENKLATNL